MGFLLLCPDPFLGPRGGTFIGGGLSSQARVHITHGRVHGRGRAGREGEASG